jgi:hypothetical protein
MFKNLLMYKHLLFSISIVAIVSLLLNIISLGSFMIRGERIRELEGAVSGLRDDIGILAGKAHVTCTDPVLQSSTGRPYVKLRANAGGEGRVTLELENLHGEPVFAINIREVLVGYDRKQGRIAADYRSAPTFKEVGRNATCSGIIDPGDSLVCESDSFSDVIARTVEGGGNAFVIKHVAVELDVKPYYFMASDLCVRIS